MTSRDPQAEPGGPDREAARLFDAARALFDEVCELDEAARDTRLADAAPRVAELVRELLAEDAAPRHGLDTPPLARRAEATGGERVPKRLGRFEVLERLGVGGMGVVYRARQESPDRVVALKVVRSAAVTEDGLRRFRHEAEVLGWLDHPGIARIYEAGTADTGHGEEPWFAMELVEGRPVTRYANEEGLGVEARLELLASICDAVQYAHRKGVVHRDLKPGNVLVTDDGRPKVLDFGMARASSTESRLSTLHTRTGELLGTLPYMSPEQLAGDPAAVDTRTDVYALGVLAYELLAGVLPHDVVGRAVHDAARVVAEDEPTSLGVRDRALRGDVETIVGKAMAKEPERRYSSADELAGDLRRYLADEPILARRPTIGYQLAKFARRNRAFVAGVAAVFVALVAGTVTSTTLYFGKERQRAAAREAQQAAELAGERERAAREAAETALAREETARGAAEEQRARAETARAEAEDALALRAEVLERFVDVFRAATPWGDGMDVRVVDVLDRAAERSRDAFEDHPLTRATLLSTFALAYSGLGLYERALPLAEEEVRLLEEHDEALEATMARGRLGYLRAKLGDPAGIEAMEAALAELEAADGPVVARVRLGARLCETLQRRGRAQEAEEYALRAIELAGTSPSEELFDTEFTAWKALGDARMNLGRFEDARGSLERALELAQALPGAQIQRVLTTNSLAVLHARLGEPRRAIELIEDVLTVMRALGAERHEFFVIQLSNAAMFHQMAGESERAIELFEESLALGRELSDGPSRSEATTLGNLAESLRQLGEPARAVELGREALALQVRFHGARSDRAANTMCTLAMALVDVGEHEEAATLLAEAIAIKGEVVPGHPSIGANRTWLAEARLGAREWTAAAEAARAALDELARTAPDATSTVALALTCEAAARGLGGEPAAALALAEQGVERAEALTGEPWLGARARGVLGLVTALAGEPAEGRARFAEALREVEELLGAGDPRSVRLRALVAAALEAPDRK